MRHPCTHGTPLRHLGETLVVCAFVGFITSFEAIAEQSRSPAAALEIKMSKMLADSKLRLERSHYIENEQFLLTFVVASGGPVLLDFGDRTGAHLPSTISLHLKTPDNKTFEILPKSHVFGSGKYERMLARPQTGEPAELLFKFSDYVIKTPDQNMILTTNQGPTPLIAGEYALTARYTSPKPGSESIAKDVQLWQGTLTTPPFDFTMGPNALVVPKE